MAKDNNQIEAVEDTARNEIAIIDERTIRDKIYVVRGVQVMLDFELAELYGYETKNFNRQVKNNADRFEGDEFMFQLTDDEVAELSRCKNFTLNRGTGRGSNIKYNPHAFTEQGIYMLMTVLRGELAVRQSRALVMTFKAMKDYIVETQGLASQRDVLRISIQTTENTEAIINVQNLLAQQQKLLVEHDDKILNAFEQISDTVKKSEISPILMDFAKPVEQREYLFLNGQPVKADVTYIDIYSQAKHSIHIVDDYINIKTLYLLQDVKSGVKVTVFSDNNYNKLHASDYIDFQREFAHLSVDFIRTQKQFHDRFIVLDYDTDEERIFHCGGSSKDGGNKVMVITELEEGFVRNGIHEEIKNMLSNPELILV